MSTERWEITGEMHEGDGTGGVGIRTPTGGCVFVTRWTDRGEPRHATALDWAEAKAIVEAMNAKTAQQ